MRTNEGRELGEVRDILATGANEVLIVRGEREYLIPFIEDVIMKVSPEEGEIVIEPLEGLLD